MALALISVLPTLPAQEAIPPTDAPADPAPAGNRETTTPPPPAENLPERPFEEFAPEGFTNPLDDAADDAIFDATSPDDLDALPGLGEGPTDGTQFVPANPDAATDAAESAAGVGVQRAPTGAPGSLQNFFAPGSEPSFLTNSQAFTLPYTTNQTASVGRTRTRVGPFRVGLNLSASTAYNDNVFGSSTNRKGDIVSSVTPTLYLRSGTRGNFELLYAPTFQAYATYTSQNTTNETLLVNAGYTFTKLMVGGSFGYSTRNGLFPDSDGTAAQSTYNLSAFAGYRIGPKTQARLTYNGQLQQSDPGGDVATNALTLSSDYVLTKKTVVGGALTGGLVNGTFNDQVFVAVNGLATWRADSRLSFSGSGGVEARQLSTTDSGSKVLVSPIFELGGTWQAAANTSINLRLYRNVTTNSFNSVQTLINTGASVGASHLLWKKVSLNATSGVSYTEQVDPFGGQSDDYTYVYASVSAGYTFQSFLTFSLFYNRQQRLSEAANNSYDTNIFGLSLSTSF